ncbi:MAG: hypothetical protein R3C61_18015 [Bacteroidia bacterium]
MNNLKYLNVFLLSIFVTCKVSAQEQQNKLGFFFQSEYSAMFLSSHIGNAIGFSMGISSKSRKFDIGILYYGRSGPINNHKTFTLQLDPGESYKGKTSLELGADHGFIGLNIAYNLRLNNNKWLIRIPISFGQIGAGFYLKGEDRITPDGLRVSEWEDILQDGTDAGFGLASEIGVQAFYQPFKNKHLQLGGGVNYTNTYGYSSFLGGDNFYNNKPRLNIGVRINL